MSSHSPPMLDWIFTDIVGPLFLLCAVVMLILSQTGMPRWRGRPPR